MAFDPNKAPSFCKAVLNPDGKSITVTYDNTVPEATGYVVWGAFVAAGKPPTTKTYPDADKDGSVVVGPSLSKGDYHFNCSAMGGQPLLFSKATAAPPVTVS